MSVAGVPQVINDYNMYLTGSKLVGMTEEVALPDLEAMTETIRGAGMLGEISVADIGHFPSIQQEVPFRIFDSEAAKLIKFMEAVDLTLRAAQQYLNPSTMSTDMKGMRVVFRGQCTGIKPGSVKQGGMMSSSVTIEVLYYLLEVDGEKVMELDKVNPKFVVNGVDMLAKAQSLC